MNLLVRWHTGRPVEKRPTQEQLELEDMTLEQVLPNASSDSVPLYKQLVELSKSATTTGLTREWIQHILAQFDSFCQLVLVKSRFQLWDEPYRIRDEYNALYKNPTEAKTLPIFVAVARILTYGELLRQVHFASIETTLLRTPPKELLRVEQPLSDVTPHDFFGNELVTSTRTDRYPSNRWGIYTDLSRPLQPQVMACCYQPADDSPGCWISLMGDKQPFGLPLQYTLVMNDYWQALAGNNMAATQLAAAFQKDFQVGTAFLNVNRFQKLDKTIQAHLPAFATMLQKAYIAYIEKLDEAIVDETPLPLSPSLSLSPMDFLLAKSMMMLLFQYNEPHNVSYPSGNELSWMDTHFFKTPGVAEHWTVNNRGGLWSDDNSRMLPFLPQVDWNKINVNLYDKAIDVLEDAKIVFNNLKLVRNDMLLKVSAMRSQVENASNDTDKMKNARELLSFNNKLAETYLTKFSVFQVEFAKRVLALNALISRARNLEITTVEIDAVPEIMYPDESPNFAKLLKQAKKEKRIEDAGKAVFSGVVTASLPDLAKTKSNAVKGVYDTQKTLFGKVLPIYQDAMAVQKLETKFSASTAALSAYKQVAFKIEQSLAILLQSIQTNIVRLNLVAGDLAVGELIPPGLLGDAEMPAKKQKSAVARLKKAETAWEKTQSEAERLEQEAAKERERLRLEEEAREKAAAAEAERLRVEEENRREEEANRERTITIPSNVIKNVSYDIVPPPRSGPSFYEKKIEWMQNSCWMDSIFTALFAYPGNAYAKSILEATEMRGKRCTDEEFLNIHRAICKDILQLSTPLTAQNQVCPLDARKVWNKCVENPIAINNLGSPSDVIETLQLLYGRNTLVLKQMSWEIFLKQSSKVAPKKDCIFYAYSSEKQEQKNSFETVSTAVNGYTLTAVILHGANHFIVNLLDLYNANDWYTINYTPDLDDKVKRIVTLDKLPPGKAIENVVIKAASYATEVDGVVYNLPPADDKTFVPTHFIYMRNDEIKHLQDVVLVVNSSSPLVDEAIKITRSITATPQTPVAPLEALAEQDDEIHSVLEEASVVGDLQQDELVRERIAKRLRTLTNDNPADASYAALNDEFSSESLDKIPEQVLELLNVADALIYDDDEFIDTLIGQLRSSESIERELDASSARILSKQRGEIIDTLGDADIFSEE